MLTIPELKKIWNEDSVINDTKISQESSRVPVLHSKYLSYLMDTRIEHRKLYQECLNHRRILTKYFKGLLSKEELKERGWEPYQGKTPIKSELENLIEEHPMYMESETRLNELTIIQDALESILKSIHSRTFEIKNLLQAKIFEAGG